MLDDKLAYLVCDRLGLPKLFLPDLVVTLVTAGKMGKQLGKEICQVIASRYSSGMVEHTLQILDKGERKWLK